MLTINQIYILKIIFDNEEFHLSYAIGNNPKFNFEETIRKEIIYEKLEQKFLEISILTTSYKTLEEIKGKTKEEILNSSNLYSALRIDLLTLAIAPEHHDIALVDPRKQYLTLGRINYVVKCNHIETIDFNIESLKITMNSLMKNDISLKLKFKNQNTTVETPHTKSIPSNMNNKEETTTFELEEGDSQMLTFSSETSINAFRNAESVIKIFTFRLIDTCAANCERRVSGLKTVKTMNPYGLRHLKQKNSTTSLNGETKQINLGKTYTQIGYVRLNFFKMLSENDNLITKQTSKFFLSMNNKNDNGKLNNNIDGSLSRIDEELKFQIFETVNEEYYDEIYWEGNHLGDIVMKVKISSLPLIRQVMCGVMTETGFEINSIFLYENNILNNGELPIQLTSLIKVKNDLEMAIANRTQLKSNKESEDDFNKTTLKYFNGIKELLMQSIEESCLYYGYSSNMDLYKGQAVMLELGLNIIEFIDRLNIEQRTICFDILKLINERIEFDSGTISLNWFKDNKTKSSFEFRDDFIIQNRIVENFIRLNNEQIRICLEGITRGKNIDNDTKKFMSFYLSVAYFRVPKYRNEFISGIMTDVKNEETILFKSDQKRSLDEFIEQDPINNLILWDNLFYKKLYSAIAATKENVDDLNDAIAEMNSIIECQITSRMTWKSKISKRDYVFIELVRNLITYVKGKVSAEVDINWLNIPGFSSIIQAIKHEMKSTPVDKYSKLLIQVIPMFCTNNVNIINSLCEIFVRRTNAYDVKAVFNLVFMYDLIFQECEKDKEPIKEKLNYYQLQASFRIIISIDNSLCLGKFLWLYYKHAINMSLNHVNEIANSVFVPKFFSFFFHWSFVVRQAFYYLLLYVFGHGLKGKLHTVYLNERSNSNFMITKGNSAKSAELNGGSDIFEMKMQVIRNIQSIIYTEDLDATFKNQISKASFGNVLEGIEEKNYPNIVIAMHHYDSVVDEFTKWEEKNKGDVVDYPELDVSPPKEDVVEYNSENN